MKLSFPKEYLVLARNVFESGDYKLVPIRHEDRYTIMKWRNEQMYHLRQAQPLTAENQDYYFENIVARLFDEEKPGQLLFSFLKDDKCIAYGGLVHINWLDGNAEISFLMETELEKEQFAHLWTVYLDMIEQVAFEELNLHKIFTYAIDLRPKLYPMLTAAGYEKEAVLKEQVYFNDAYVHVILHCKFNYHE